jgi:hypothetical protein
MLRPNITSLVLTHTMKFFVINLFIENFEIMYQLEMILSNYSFTKHEQEPLNWVCITARGTGISTSI